MDAGPAAPHRWQFSLRRLMLFTTLVALHLAGFVAVFAEARGRATGLLVGQLVTQLIMATLLTTWMSLAHRRSAGRVHICLERTLSLAWLAQLGWAPLLSIALLRLLPFEMPEAVLVGLITALCWGAAYACWFLINYWMRIGELGIVYNGFAFVPWARLQRHTWHIDAHGQLTITKRWRRMAAIVPPDQRAAVEALLEEKMGPRADGGM